MGYQAWNEANSIWQPHFPNIHWSRNDHISDHHIWPTPGKLRYVGICQSYVSTARDFLIDGWCISTFFLKLCKS